MLDCYRSYINKAPKQLGCFFGWQIAPALPFLSADWFEDLSVCWNGPHEEAERVLRPRDVAEVQAEQVDVMPFPALQSAFDDSSPRPCRTTGRPLFATDLTDATIAAHVNTARGRPT